MHGSFFLESLVEVTSSDKEVDWQFVTPSQQMFMHLRFIQNIYNQIQSLMVHA